MCLTFRPLWNYVNIFSQIYIIYHFSQDPNSARTDGLVLHHWVKGDDSGTGEYRYAKYNTRLDIPDFSEEEFEKDLKDVNEDWDYKETKYLFELANQFDLRWAVVMDRSKIKKT